MSAVMLKNVELSFKKVLKIFYNSFTENIKKYVIFYFKIVEVSFLRINL